jgi:hypothetical protein
MATHPREHPVPIIAISKVIYIFVIKKEIKRQLKRAVDWHLCRRSKSVMMRKATSYIFSRGCIALQSLSIAETQSK